MKTIISKQEKLLNRVPEITIFFWIIKVLGTTIGETAADFLNVNLNLGLTVTSIVTGILLIIGLVYQFKAKRYVATRYWTVVVLISVFGTLITDNLTDSLGVPLEASTIFFSVALALTFVWWYVKEKSLSIHSIITGKREAFYWLAILFTFALGTAAGDLIAEGLGLGYATTGLIVAAAIAVFVIARRIGLNSILSFWAIYILTRPLGASIGDYLSQPQKYGGLGLGATKTTIIFVAAIILSVVYLAMSKRDVTKPAIIKEEIKYNTDEKGGLMQTVIVVILLVVLSGIGYAVRQATLNTEIPTVAVVNLSTAKPSSTFGDFSSFRTITNDTLVLVNQGDFVGAKNRIADLEYEWDNAESHLKPKNLAKWYEVDDAIDEALRKVRAVHQDTKSEKASLEALLAVLN